MLTIVSKMFLDSSRRLVRLEYFVTTLELPKEHNKLSVFIYLSSINTWSYSEEDTKKRMAVTESKHWSHFCLCERWPPTSTKRNGMELIFITNYQLKRWQKMLSMTTVWFCVYLYGNPIKIFEKIFDRVTLQE